MTKKEMLNLVKGEIEGKRGLYWLGRRTRSYSEKLNIIFVSTDLETVKSPVKGLLNAYGLSTYLATVENGDVVLVGINREKLSRADLGDIIKSLPFDILKIQDPDNQTRYTSVTMWGLTVAGINYISDNVNIVKDYHEFIVERFESGTIVKADMLNMVILHKTFEKYVLADENFISGVKNNQYSFWNMKKIMDYVNQQHVALFNDLVQE